MGRRKTIQDEDLLAVARDVFVEKGIGATTREIARRAEISETVIYQRYPTKSDLFFAAMSPPPLNVEPPIQDGADDDDVLGRLENIAIGMVEYHRQLVPILIPLMSHPSFDFEQFAEQHPESPLVRLRQGLMDFLETQQRMGRVTSGEVGPAVLALVAAMHSIALFERLGVYGGKFDDGLIRAMVRSLWWGIAPQGERTS